MVRNLFYNPECLPPREDRRAGHRRGGRPTSRNLAEHLRKWGYGAQEMAHYLIRLLFILFAEDIDLLPRDLFTRLVENGQRDAAHLQQADAPALPRHAGGRRLRREQHPLVQRRPL